MVGLKELILFLIRLAVTVSVSFFDWILSRYLVAGVIVGVLWLPAFWLWRVSESWFTVPTTILGFVLCALWEGCEIFTVGHFFEKSGFLLPRVKK